MPPPNLAVYIDILASVETTQHGDAIRDQAVSIHTWRSRSFFSRPRAAVAARKTFAISVARTWRPHAGRERGQRIHSRHTLPEVSRRGYRAVQPNDCASAFKRGRLRMETIASTPLDRLATPEDKNSEHAPAGIALPMQLFNRD